HAPPAPPSTLSLHDALPIFDAQLLPGDPARPHPVHQHPAAVAGGGAVVGAPGVEFHGGAFPDHGGQSPPRAPTPREAALTPAPADRKSTRLNSSHVKISYAV